MNIIVSGCLLGENCKYNGGNNYNQKVIDLVMNHRVISVCPEMMAGLGAPRKCVEIVNGIIMSEDGDNLDKIFRQGVNKTLSYIEDEDIDLAILQPRSPTCGSGKIYDGTFSGKLIDGDGIFVQELKQRGIKVLSPEEI